MKNIILAGLLVLMLILFTVTAFLITDSKSFILSTRANVQLVSSSNTFCFSTPACARVDESEITRLTCFCLNNKGLGVSNLQGTVEPISVDTNTFVTMKTIQGITDETGKFIVDFNSDAVGTYEFKVSCGDIDINTTQRICFE